MPTVRNDGIDIHYQVTGQGPPVVLLHSLLCSGTMWHHQLEPLAQHFRVINIDARGHGRSGRVAESFTWEAMTDDVFAVLDAEVIDQVVWVGLSMGGMTSLHAGVLRPDRVRGLVVLDSNGGVEPVWQRLELKVLGLAARLVGMRPLLPAVSRQMFCSTTRRTRRELVHAWNRRFAAADVSSVLLVLHAMISRDDLSDRLVDIRAPTLVGVGAGDHPQPPVRSRRIASRIPGARYLEIPRAGHLSAVEQPEAVTRAILDFLLSLPKAT